MSIVPSQKLSDRGPNWSVVGAWIVLLKSILEGPYGRKHGSYVYIVSYAGIPMYVGKTEKSIYDRLHSHMFPIRSERSNLGRILLLEKKHHFFGWSVEVLQIEGQIDDAERVYIRRLRPPLNKEYNRNPQEIVNLFIKVFRKR